MPHFAKIEREWLYIEFFTVKRGISSADSAFVKLILGKRKMAEFIERRREKRLRYHWPVWFAEDFNGTLSQGQMVDVSSGGAAFTCRCEDGIPYAGQRITARFSVPRLINDNSFDLESYNRVGHVCRIDETNSFLKRVAVQFAQPLPFKPAEQTITEYETDLKLSTMVI